MCKPKDLGGLGGNRSSPAIGLSFPISIIDFSLVLAFNDIEWWMDGSDQRKTRNMRE